MKPNPGEVKRKRIYIFIRKQRRSEPKMPRKKNVRFGSKICTEHAFKLKWSSV